MKLRTLLQAVLLCGIFTFALPSFSFGQDGSVAKAEKQIAKRRKKEAKAAEKEAKKAKKAFWARQSKSAKKSVKRNARRNRQSARIKSSW